MLNEHEQILICWPSFSQVRFDLLFKRQRNITQSDLTFVRAFHLPLKVSVDELITHSMQLDEGYGSELITSIIYGNPSHCIRVVNTFCCAHYCRIVYCCDVVTWNLAQLFRSRESMLHFW